MLVEKMKCPHCGWMLGGKQHHVNGTKYACPNPKCDVIFVRYWYGRHFGGGSPLEVTVVTASVCMEAEK